MGHPYKSWWVGSTLHIDEARGLVPQQNATTLQVAASVMSAVVWMIKNPQRGLNIPDHLPHREILNLAKPYLGKLQSFDVDWTPLKNREQHFVGYSERVIKPEDVWQFEAFLHA
jgi:homospermidine synthase